MRDRVQILHVDDDPDFVDLTATYLERTGEDVEVVSATSAGGGLDRLADTEIDCVVSDYEMPGTDGLEFLEAVRESHPDLPFILFTGKGSEEIASDAISAGVTDYLQKTSGGDQYELLLNRVENAVDRYDTERERRQWNQAVETATQGVAIIGPDRTFRQVNEAYADIYGVSPETLVGTTPPEWYPDDEVTRLDEEVMPELAQVGHWDGESVGRRADGTTFEQRLALSTLPDGGHVCVMEDITDRKERERQLERRTDLFERAQAIADVGAWEYDVRDDELRWTDEVYAIHGLPVGSEVTTEQAIEYYHPEDRASIRTALTRAVESGESFDLELRLVTTADETLWVRALGDPQTEAGEVVRVRGTFQDVTERRQRQREADLFRRMVELLGVGVAIYGADGEFVYVNPTFADILGTDVETLQEQQMWNINPTFDREQFDGYWSSFETGETRIHETSIRFEGSEVPVQTVTTRQTIHGETYHFGTVQDITDRVDSERELERQNERLAEFASIVSHDLRNPLEVARGQVELLRDECDSDRLDSVSRAHDRMRTLIDDLLTLAREGTAVDEVTPVSLAAVVEDCAATVETDGATFVVDTDRTITADRSRLRQLLENLFRNAIEHSGTEAVQITVGDCEGGFYIGDDGRGIPAERREDIFEWGYSTADDGIGFGLAIVRETADAHGWSVRATDGVDGGARFEITGVDVVDQY